MDGVERPRPAVEPAFNYDRPMAYIPPPLPWKRLSDLDPTHEYLLVLTHLPVKRLTSLPRFLAYTRRIQKQLDAAPAGLIGYSLLAKPHRSRYWTLTAWSDAGSMRAFVRASPHRDAMTRMREILPNFQTTQWTLIGAAVPPSWHDALARA